MPRQSRADTNDAPLAAASPARTNSLAAGRLDLEGDPQQAGGVHRRTGVAEDAQTLAGDQDAGVGAGPHEQGVAVGGGGYGRRQVGELAAAVGVDHESALGESDGRGGESDEERSERESVHGCRPQMLAARREPVALAPTCRR